MEVRRANEDDIESIKNIIDYNFDEVIAEFHSPRIVSKFKEHNSAESLKSQLKWKKVYVAVDDNGNVVGTGAFADFGTKEEPKFSISNLYVLPNLHGTKIGTEIVFVLLSDAKQCKATSFHVPSTRNAIPFYEHWGFTVDEIQTDIDDEITWMTKSM